MLDLAGLPPTAEQVRNFVENPAPDKRQHLIEVLDLVPPQVPNNADTRFDHPSDP